MCRELVGTIRTILHMVGIVILCLSTIAFVVALTTNWVRGTIVTNVPAQPTREDVYLTLWRRKYFVDPGTDESDAWSDYVSARENQPFCATVKSSPESSDAPLPPQGTATGAVGGGTYRDAFRPIQRSEAGAILAAFASGFTILFALLYAVALVRFRIFFSLCCIATVGFGAWSIAEWYNFYNFCPGDDYCGRFVGQNNVHDGKCYFDVGYGFMIAAVVLNFVGTIPLCLASAPHRGK